MAATAHHAAPVATTAPHHAAPMTAAALHHAAAMSEAPRAMTNGRAVLHSVDEAERVNGAPNVRHSHRRRLGASAAKLTADQCARGCKREDEFLHVFLLAATPGQRRTGTFGSGS